MLAALKSEVEGKGENSCHCEKTKCHCDDAELKSYEMSKDLGDTDIEKQKLGASLSISGASVSIRLEDSPRERPVETAGGFDDARQEPTDDEPLATRPTADNAPLLRRCLGDEPADAPAENEPAALPRPSPRATSSCGDASWGCIWEPRSCETSEPGSDWLEAEALKRLAETAGNYLDALESRESCRGQEAVEALKRRARELLEREEESEEQAERLLQRQRALGGAEVRLTGLEAALQRRGEAPPAAREKTSVEDMRQR